MAGRPGGSVCFGIQLTAALGLVPHQLLWTAFTLCLHPYGLEDGVKEGQKVA